MIGEVTSDGSNLWVNTSIGCVFRMRCDGVFNETLEPIMVDVNLVRENVIEVIQLVEGNKEFIANPEIVISPPGTFEAVSVSKSKYWYVEFMEEFEGEFEEKSVCIARHPNDWIKCKKEWMEGMKSEGLPFSTFEITNTRPIDKEEYQRFHESGRR